MIYADPLRRQTLANYSEDTSGIFDRWLSLAWYVGTAENHLPGAQTATQGRVLKLSQRSKPYMIEPIRDVSHVLEEIHEMHSPKLRYESQIIPLRKEIVFYTSIGTTSNDSPGTLEEDVRLLDNCATKILRAAKIPPDWYKASYAFDPKNLADNILETTK